MLEFIINYWYVIVAAMAITAVSVVLVIRFVKTPSAEQLKQIRKWLLYAVTEAEKMFGSKSGQLKLRYVYDQFVSKFPWLAKIVSFDLFSKLVDEALEEMRNMLDTNDTIAEYVVGKEYTP